MLLKYENKFQFDKWEYLHKKLQYLLDIHSNQGNKKAIFPFDLQYLLNPEFNEEKKSYTINNIKSIEEARLIIHNRLQYLLNIHKINLKKPFPLDLSYMLNINLSLIKESIKYDLNYNYNRFLPTNYYKSYYPDYFKNKKFYNKLYFYDLEYCDKEEVDYYLNEGYILDEPSNDYLLWKSSLNDNIYDYNRSNDKKKYNPDNYINDNEKNNSDNYINIDEFNFFYLN